MIKIALIGIVSVLAAIQFKSGKSEYGILISLTGCVLIFYFSAGKLSTIVDSINQIRGYLSVNSEYLSILLKIIGITYIAEFSSNLCKDAGYAAIGNQIELAGKLSIMALSMPILLALLDTIDRFLTA
ncbi:stage III sporulation protein AD [Clostridium sp. Marseille-P299]|uniref:stage III sporulation protein AD n=1 Tax=Clostridium sp. Marseille-P299 TaxID=1805477 RepID=UPI000834353D|nr:stage III sporulation protein AD [Clostridium sp. Marseille-P299]